MRETLKVAEILLKRDSLLQRKTKIPGQPFTTQLGKNINYYFL